MLCSYMSPSYQVSVYRTIGPLVTNCEAVSANRFDELP